MHICYNSFSLLSKSKIYLLCIFLLLPIFSFSQTEELRKTYVDSMMQIVNKTKGDEKLQALNKTVWKIGMYPERFNLVDILEKEAIRQNNRTLQGNANYYRAECYYFIKQQYDSSLFYLDKAEALKFDKTDKDPFRLRFYNYLYDKKYLTALYYIEKYLKEESTEKKSMDDAIAHICLGSLYLQMGSYESSATTIKKALEILDNLRPYESNNLLRYETLLLLFRAYSQGQNYSSAYELTDSLFASFEIVKETEVEFDLADIKRFETFMHAEVIRLYINIGELKKARILLDLFNDYVQNNLHDLNATHAVNYMEAMYYNEDKKFNKAFEYIERRQKESSPESRMLRSDILHNLGRNKEAYEILKNEIQVKDSLQSKGITTQILELETIYKVNQMKSEIDVKTIQIERNRIIIVAFIAFSLLLLFVTILTIRNKKDKEKKNVKIYNQYQLMKSYLDQIRKQRDELKLAREDQEEETINWAERANNYLLETEAFKKEDLSRDDLALALGTNRQYLIDAIKNETGKTFKDYINSIRIEYAYEMLITDWDANIESIYIASGFTTRSTFNRLFKEYYGMNPIEMREAAKQKEEVIVENNEKID